MLLVLIVDELDFALISHDSNGLQIFVRASHHIYGTGVGTH